MTPANHSEAVDKLLQLGDCREFPASFDYLSLGLTEADIPELIRIATDRDLLWAEDDGALFWAPLHAWRALGWLRAQEAIEPLIRLFDEGDELDDINDWLDDIMPRTFARIGPSAVPALTAYLHDETHSMWARTTALNCLEHMGRQHRAAYSACVGAIVTQLERFRTQEPEFNGFLVSSLIDMDAAEALPLMERAYQSGYVDESICGDFQQVRELFGLIPASGIFDTL